MKKSCSIILNDDVWTCRILTEEEYATKHPGGSIAITDAEAKEIDFTEDNTDLVTIYHELTHAYQSYLCLEDTCKIELDDHYEIQATFMQKYNLKIIENALIIRLKFHNERKPLAEWKKVKKFL